MWHYFLPRRQPSKISRAAILDDYLLYDQFTTTRAGGAVNGTSAEPKGGTRTVTDANNKFSIANGALSIATGSVVYDNISWTAVTNVLGRAAFCKMTPETDLDFGYSISGVSYVPDGFEFYTPNEIYYFADNYAGGSALIGVFSFTTYDLCLIMRTEGHWYFIQGGAFAQWTLLWVSAASSSGTRPSVSALATTGTGTVDNVRVPKRLYIPVPLQSDGMSAATTDGAGNAEANGAVGNSYTNVGTWGVSGGARSCSALSGGVGFSYLACTSSNVIIDAEVTRSGGVAGIVARYADANNYLIAYHDGTNAKLDKVVAGSTTNLLSAAATYSAGAILRLALDGTDARLFYNNAAIGTVATTPAAGSLNHGLYTTNTGNTFDDLVIWARGNEGQYNGLDSL